MEKGTVSRLAKDNKPFGWIRRSNGSELFFHFSKYPGTPKVGDEVEYEVFTDATKPAGKHESATNTRVVAKTSVNPAPAIPTMLVPQKAVEPLEANVEVLVNDKHISTPEEFQLDVIIRVTDFQDKPIRGASVQLTCEGVPTSLPAPNPNTNGQGEAHFRIWFQRTENPDGSPGPELEITTLVLAATVTAFGKSLVVTEMFPRGTFYQLVSSTPSLAQPVSSPAASPSQPTPEPSVFAEPLGFSNDAYNYRIKTLADKDNKASGKAAEIVADTGGLDAEVSYAHQSGVNFQAATGGEFTSNNNGQVFVRVKLLGSNRQRGNIRFVIKGTNALTQDLFVKTPLSVAP